MIVCDALLLVIFYLILTVFSQDVFILFVCTGFDNKIFEVLFTFFIVDRPRSVVKDILPSIDPLDPLLRLLTDTTSVIAFSDDMHDLFESRLIYCFQDEINAD